ncbi:MAG: hypothetical protein K9L74_00405 [Candidatus Izimaplasma sp.]|nr:hypothetical protein [Candidatus Izimaplasma bacterium]
MKNLIIILSIVLITGVVAFQPVKADMGPKPSVSVTITGVTEPYSFDLLIKNETLVVGSPEEYLLENYYNGVYPDELISYQEDGFVSYYLYNGIPSHIDQVSEHTYEMNYIAPSSFKIVIVTEAGAIITSDYITTSIFEADITWDLADVDLTTSQDNVGELTGNIDGQDNQFWTIATQLIYRVIGTLIIELGILFLFMYRAKRTFKIATFTNIVTQVSLTLLTVNAYIYGGTFLFILALLLGELIILFIEGIVYVLSFKEKPKWLAIIYTVVANFLSLLLSIILTGMI